jgi:hypothetical protein
MPPRWADGGSRRGSRIGRNASTLSSPRMPLPRRVSPDTLRPSPTYLERQGRARRPVRGRPCLGRTGDGDLRRGAQRSFRDASVDGGPSAVAGLGSGGQDMRETWRWFGPPDPITLAEVRQTGGEGHRQRAASRPLRRRLGRRRGRGPQGRDRGGGADLGRDREHPGLGGDQDGTGPWRAHVAAWIDSLRAVVEADGPRVICYNFMPVLDWTRTDLRHPVEGGGTAMRFDLTDFAAFDLHLLLGTVRRRIIPMTCARWPASAPPHSTPSRPRRWPRTSPRAYPGSTESWTLDDVRACLADYAGWAPTTCAAT